MPPLYLPPIMLRPTLLYLIFRLTILQAPSKNLAEVHVIKEGNNVIGGFVNPQIARKWCVQDAELKHLFAIVRKRSEHKETEK